MATDPLTPQAPDIDAQTLENFALGDPRLVCRWRIAGGALPLLGRHLRALSYRLIDGKPLDQNLLNWAKQHLEWNLFSSTRNLSDGVLMLVVDEELHAAMSAGPYVALKDTTAQALLGRAQAARTEAEQTGVEPEVIWTLSDGVLTAASALGARAATTSLVVDLAQSLGAAIAFDPDLLDKLREQVEATNDAAAPEMQDKLVLFSSDEHGIMLASYASAEKNNAADTQLARKLCNGYQRLLQVEAARAKLKMSFALLSRLERLTRKIDVAGNLLAGHAGDKIVRYLCIVCRGALHYLVEGLIGVRVGKRVLPGLVLLVSPGSPVVGQATVREALDERVRANLALKSANRARGVRAIGLGHGVEGVHVQNGIGKGSWGNKAVVGNGRHVGNQRSYYAQDLRRAGHAVRNGKLRGLQVVLLPKQPGVEVGLDNRVDLGGRTLELGVCLDCGKLH